MRVLLIWQEVPESIRFFGLTDPSAEEIHVLNLAHGEFINAVDTDPAVEAALTLINAALSESSTGFEGEAIDWVSRWCGSEIKEDDLPAAGAFHMVFTAGFLL